MDNIDFKQGSCVFSALKPVFDQYSYNHCCNVYYEDDSLDIIPYSYSVMEEIVGLTLSCSNDEDTFYCVGEALAKLHSISLSFWGPVTEKSQAASVNDYYTMYYNKVLHNLDKYDKHLYRIVTEVIENNYCPCLYAGRAPVLLHHDFHFSNIMVSTNKNIKFIDWDSARGGLEELDFVKLKYMNLLHLPLSKLQSFISGYNSHRTLELNQNYYVYELVWLAKMVIFESNNSNDNKSYYPSKQFYLEMLKKSLDRIDTYDEMLLTPNRYSINAWLSNCI